MKNFGIDLGEKTSENLSINSASAALASLRCIHPLSKDAPHLLLGFAHLL